MTGVAIVAAEERFAPAVGAGETAAEHIVRAYSPHPFPGDTVADAPVAYARIDHARWLVDCPLPRCGSSQYASRLDHRFSCVVCNNGGTGQWVRVEWPDDPAAVEATFSEATDPTRINWRPDRAGL